MRSAVVHCLNEPSSGLQAETVDRVIVSTDDPAVRDACKGLDVVVLGRSEFLSTDTACTVDVVRDVFRKLGIPGVVILLQPTSPFREACDIDEAVRLLQRPRYPIGSDRLCLGPPCREWSFRSDGWRNDTNFRLGQVWETLSRSSRAVRAQRICVRRPVATPRCGGRRELVTRGAILDMSPLRTGIDIDTQDDLLLATAIEALEGGATREGER
ncbi:MAG: hypothetical protein IPQ14_06305 [Candidatus Microthrix sp.]|nr:hypothetical protein [Candidatus Microthrix sp.]